MNHMNYWHKQDTQSPPYPDLMWSRPENRQFAGKLLIVGGNLHGLSAPAEAYKQSVKAGIGAAKVLLPDAVQKIVGRIVENGEYAPSTPSGSFSQAALGTFLDMANWSDGVLLAGDFGRNSETAILLEKFIAKSPSHITLTKDAVDYMLTNPAPVLSRQNTLLVLSFAQLQKLGTSAHSVKPFTFSMDLMRLVEALHELTTAHNAAIVVEHLNTIFVAVNGQVGSLKLPASEPVWRVKYATHAAVWRLQNPSKVFEALTTAVYSCSST